MTAPEDKLRQLIKEFSVALLVTRTQRGELRARPMVVADVDADGTVWLVTNRNSGKMDEISDDSHVNLTMQTSAKAVSISGRACPIEDRDKLDKVWNEGWKVWFPEGKQDPSLILIRISGEEAEYWDNSGFQGVKYLIEAGRAYLHGTRPQVGSDTAIHGKVHL